MSYLLVYVAMFILVPDITMSYYIFLYTLCIPSPAISLVLEQSNWITSLATDNGYDPQSALQSGLGFLGYLFLCTVSSW